MKKIFIIAGEASGDNIGASIISKLRNIFPDIEIHGIGGEKMINQGLKTLFPMEELSIMGFFEIIPHIFNLLRRIHQTINSINELKPNILLTIDSPGYCFRVAKSINNKKIKKIHYVAPSVWAYKPERAKKIARIYNHLLTLLPFETQYFEKEGLASSFVGHPIIENLYKNEYNNNSEIKYEKNKYRLCMNLGSRKTEIKYLLPIFVETVKKFTELVENVEVIIPSFEHLSAEIEIYLSQTKIDYKIITDSNEKISYISSADLALTKSGTISLELASYNIPMIVGHKINAFTAYFLKKIILIKYVSLVNIIQDQEIIPEFLQEKCTVDNLFRSLYSLYCNKSSQDLQRRHFKDVMSKLGAFQKESPSEKAANIIVNMLNNEIY